MKFISQWSNKLATLGEWIGVAGILIMVAVTCVDVTGAKLFTLPVPGAIEIVSLVQAATMVFAVAVTQRHKGHISVEMFVEKMNPRIRAIVRAFISMLGFILFVLLVYEGIRFGNQYVETGEVTATVQIPFYPFAYAISIALLPVAMMMLVDMVGAVREVLS